MQLTPIVAHRTKMSPYGYGQLPLNKLSVYHKTLNKWGPAVLWLDL